MLTSTVSDEIFAQFFICFAYINTNPVIHFKKISNSDKKYSFVFLRKESIKILRHLYKYILPGPVSGSWDR